MFAIFHPCKSGLVATLKLNCSRGGLFVEAKAIVASQNASHLGSGIASVSAQYLSTVFTIHMLNALKL